MFFLEDLEYLLNVGEKYSNFAFLCYRCVNIFFVDFVLMSFSQIPKQTWVSSRPSAYYVGWQCCLLQLFDNA